MAMSLECLFIGFAVLNIQQTHSTVLVDSTLQDGGITKELGYRTRLLNHPQP